MLNPSRSIVKKGEDALRLVLLLVALAKHYSRYLGLVNASRFTASFSSGRSKSVLVTLHLASRRLGAIIFFLGVLARRWSEASASSLARVLSCSRAASACSSALRTLWWAASSSAKSSWMSAAMAA